MLLLLDESASDRSFAKRLRDVGHDVVTSVDVLGVGAADRSIAAFAMDRERVAVTRDCDDFRTLYEHQASHPGLLLIYGGRAATSLLVTAIDRIADLYPDTTGLIFTLSDFFW